MGWQDWRVHLQEWTVVVPVKRLAGAKSRLHAKPLGVPHADLVLAMARDTVAASSACPLVAEVLVVTDDPRAHRALAALGARVVPDRPDAGLNAAVTYGAGTAARPAPEPRPGRTAQQARTARRPRAVAAITADLPALRPHDLAAALRAAAAVPSRGFVTDAAGSGTTLLAAPPEVPIDPRFGARSAYAHEASGARRLDGDWPSLRRDVDTLADLVDAARLGLGPHTAALVGSGLAAPAASGHDDEAARIAAGHEKVGWWHGAGSGSG